MQDVDRRIDKLELTVNELRNELRTLRVLVRTDYPSALNKIRFITEKILSQLCKQYDVSWGKAEPTLENMIGPLISNEIIPKPMSIHVRSIQTNTSPGSHFQESPLSSAHLDIAQMALVEFLEWYYSTHPNAVAVSRPVPTRMAPSPPVSASSGAGASGGSGGGETGAAAVLLGSAPPQAESQTSTLERPRHRASPASVQEGSWLVPGCMISLTLGFCFVVLVVVGIIIYYSTRPNPTPRPTGGGGTVTGGGATTVASVEIPVDAHNKSVADLCTGYEERITKLLASKNYLQAINVVADYQMDMLHHRPPPTFQDGQFAAETHGLSFNLASLADWKPQKMGKEEEEATWSLGTEFLLAARGPNEEDIIFLIALDYEALINRLGDPEATTYDQNIKAFAIPSVRTFGTLSDQEFEEVGDLRVLRVQITPFAVANTIAACAFQRNGYVFIIVSSSPVSKKLANEARLNSILKGLKFDDRRDSDKAVKAIRAQIANPDDIPQTLRATRQLALSDQFREASRELSRLSFVISKALPVPTIDGNVAQDYAYGLKLKNPNPERWKLNITIDGVIKSIILEDNLSTVGGSIAIIPFNPVLTSGPQSLRFLAPNAPEAQLKETLQQFGQSFFMNIGGKMEEDSYFKFRGLTAYAISGTRGAPGGSRLKLIILPQPECFLMIGLEGKPQELKEYESLLESVLELRDTPVKQ